MDTITLIEDLEEAQRLLQKKFPPEQFGEDAEVEIIWNALEQAKYILNGQMSLQNNDLAEDSQPTKIPDGEGDWTTGAETFTRQEVLKLLYTQRAMISNDMKVACWNELPESAKQIVLNPRKPQI